MGKTWALAAVKALIDFQKLSCVLALSASHSHREIFNGNYYIGVTKDLIAGYIVIRKKVKGNSGKKTIVLRFAGILAAVFFCCLAARRGAGAGCLVVPP